MAISFRSTIASIGANVLAGANERAVRWAVGQTVGEEPVTIYESDPAKRPVKPVDTRPAEGYYGGESYGDTALYNDDLGWIPEATAMMGQSPGEIGPYDRRKTVERARLYYVKDAMSKAAVRLYTTYCVGGGFSIKARDYKSDPTKDAVPAGADPSDFVDEQDDETKQLQQEADSFWKHPANSPVFSTEAQTINSDKLNVDGELFYVLIPPVGEDTLEVNAHGDLVQGDSVTRVRIIKDCLQISAIYYNPQDDSEPWYYLRTWREGPWGQQKTRHALYPDHRLFFSSPVDDNGQLTLPPTPKGVGALDDAVVMSKQFIYHQKVNTISERGNSVLTTVMDWTKVNRLYLEDRATISKAHARIAWKRIIKGPANLIANFGKKNLSAGGTTGLPVPSMAGQTLNTNQGMDWEAQNAQDGGKNAYIESRNFRLMFYAGVGFAEHYFGDGSNGTRATSKSMERPTELQLQAYQTILKGGYEVMFAFHLAATGREYDAHAVWVDAPQILEDDTATVITSILEVIAVLPEFDIDEVILKMLNAFSIDDPQDVLQKIRRRQKQLYAQYLQLVYAQAGIDPATIGTSADGTPDVTAIPKLLNVISMLTPGSDTTTMPGPKRAPQFAQGGLGAKLATRKPAPKGTRMTDPLKTA